MARVSKKECSTAGKKLASKTTSLFYKKDAGKTLAKCKTATKKTASKKKK